MPVFQMSAYNLFSILFLEIIKNQQMIISLKSVHLLIILAICGCFCQNNQESNTIIGIKFQSINGKQNQSISMTKNDNLITFDSLIKILQENPEQLLQKKNIFVQRWPAQIQSIQNNKNVKSSNLGRVETVKSQTKTANTSIPASQSADKNKQNIKINPQIITQGANQNPNPNSNTILGNTQVANNNNNVGLLASGKGAAPVLPNSSNSIRQQIQNTLSLSRGKDNSADLLSGVTRQSAKSNQKSNTGSTGQALEQSSQKAQPNSAGLVQKSAQNQKQPTSGSIQDMRNYMIYIMNQLRDKYNVRQVSFSPLLTKIAQDHSNDMVNRKFFAHKNPDGENVGDRANRNNYFGMIGENLAQSFSMDQAQQGFINSPSHFQNAINNQWEKIGVGISKQGSTLFTTVLFSPRDIESTALSKQQLSSFKPSLAQAVSSQSPNLKYYDGKISQITQNWLQSNRSVSLMSFVAAQGNYRVPMTAAQYSVDYSPDFVDRVKKNGYFKNENPMLSRFGIGIKQQGQKLQIYFVYM